MPQAKTTKRQPSQLRRILTKLTPTTRKSQLLVFMVVFAAIGGGVYLYQSHAQVTWQVTNTYTAADSELKVSTSVWAGKSWAYVLANRKTDSSVSAANKTVYSIPQPKNSLMYTSAAVAKSKLSGVRLRVSDANGQKMTYRVCAWMNHAPSRNTLSALSAHVMSPGEDYLNEGGGGSSIVISETLGAYKGYCVPLDGVPSLAGKNQSAVEDLYIYTQMDEDVPSFNVWKITLERSSESLDLANSTNRQDMANMLYSAFYASQSGNANSGAASKLGTLPSLGMSCGSGKPGPYRDIPGSYPNCQQYDFMKVSGISTGNSDGTFGPYTMVTRQAAAALLYHFAGSPAVPSAAELCGAGKPGPFSDVPSTHPFCKEIAWMKANNYTTGYTDGSFRPAETVSRGAAIMFVWRVMGQPEASYQYRAYTDVAKSNAYYEAVQWYASVKR